jgi:hypothetical protein
MTDLICRRSCDASASTAQDDGGMADEDAGMSKPGPGACPGASKCVDFTGSGLDLGGVHGDPLGQCE